MYKTNDNMISKEFARVDWIIRYEPVLRHILSARKYISVLDYGCGPVGLGSVYTGQYYGIDVDPIAPSVSNMVAINGVHPFLLDKQFDLVCAMDVVEHVPLSDHEEFWKTLRRVTRKTLILGVPVNHNFDVEYLSLILAQSFEIPRWLLEHLAQPLPDDSYILNRLTQNGFKVINKTNQLTRAEYYYGAGNNVLSGVLKINFLNDIYHSETVIEDGMFSSMYRAVWVAEVM
jgi:hypothetical protein